MVPLCCSIIFLHIERPSPVPLCFEVTKGSNILENIFSGIPDPESSIIISTWLFFLFMKQSTFP